MSTQYTKYDFAQKTDSEGGVGEMIGWAGEDLSRYDLPADFKTDWKKLVALYEKISSQIYEWFDEEREDEE